MSETALVAVMPELEPLVARVRAVHTADGERGMPPHVTVLYPFADDAALEPLLPRVAAALEPFASFDVAFATTARWPEILYLEPRPAEPFVALTEALVEIFPQFPPYAGAFDEIVPHLTVAHGEAGLFDDVEAELRPLLPVAVRVERVWLFADTADGWRRHTAFPLG